MRLRYAAVLERRRASREAVAAAAAQWQEAQDKEMARRRLVGAAYIDDAAMYAALDTDVRPPPPNPPALVPVRVAAPAPAVFDRDAARRAALGVRHADALSSVEEQAGNVEEMPDLPNYRIAKMLTTSHAGFSERFIMLTFLTMNRCPPVLVVELMLAAGQLANQSAVDHLLNLLKKMKTGDFDKYRAYCMETKSWQEVLPPRGSGSDWSGAGSDWSAAIDLARRQRSQVGPS